MIVEGSNDMDLTVWLNLRTLILGEVKTGKSRLTSTVVARMAAAGFSEQTILLDLAPRITGGIGGRIQPPSPGILYLTTDIVPPRLTGKTEAEVEALAVRNAAAIEPLLDRCLASSRRVLVINDATLYLQAGNPDRLMILLNRPATLIVNAYYGRTLGGTEFSLRERRRIDAIRPLFDRVVHLAEKATPARLKGGPGS
ncbi:MAG: hypothetical protein ACOWWM_05280 [Desulfobacterales bacterium]